MSKEINVSASGGQAAGRDIFNNHTTLVQFPERRPESQQQSEFAQRTGIWCPKPAREWLEYLMEHQRFTARELVVSWKAGSIGWNAEKDERRIVTPQFEAIFAWGLVGTLGFYFVIVAGHFIWGSGVENKWGMAATFGFGAMYLATCWLSNRFMLWPRRVAQRIRRVEEATAASHRNFSRLVPSEESQEGVEL